MNVGKIFGIDENALDVPFKLEKLFIKLHSYGIHIPNGCRFQKFQKNFSRFIQTVIKRNQEIESGELIKLIEGYKDYMELSLICSCEKLLLTAQNEIRTMLGGSVHPSEDSNSTASARNYQYQLALTAKFELSNLPIKIKEPDFTFKFQGKEYSVAAKRLISKGEIERNIKKAERQINISSNYGFIALSFDRLYSEKDRLLNINNPDTSIRVGQEMMLSILCEDFKERYFSNRNNQILGIIASIAIPFTNPKFEPGYSSFTMFLPIAEPQTSEWNETTRIMECLNINFSQIKGIG